MNVSLKDSKTIKPKNLNNFKRPIDDSVQDAVNFFNNEANINLDNFENNDYANINNIELNNKIKELNLEIQRIKEEYRLNEKNYIQEINILKQQNANKNEYDQIIQELEDKYTNLEKEYETKKKKIISDNKDIINKLKKENQKLKKEKENLIKLCSKLKIEVNRLENNLSIAQNVIEEATNMNYDINDNAIVNENDIGNEINYDEINDIKKKTQELIEPNPFDKKHFIEPSKIKQQAIDTVEKVMREKIPDDFYKEEESNINYDNYENYNNFSEINNEFRERNREENKEEDYGNDNLKNILNMTKQKMIKRTKRK